MISMPRIQSIRQLRRNGESIASIARKVGAGEPTVRKYLEAGDLSPKPPVRKRRASAIDEYVPAIEQWLAEDRGTWHRRRHVFCQIFVGRFGVSFSPFERLFLGRFGFGQSCGLSVIA